jgi:hypothetical protein
VSYGVAHHLGDQKQGAFEGISRDVRPQRVADRKACVTACLCVDRHLEPEQLAHPERGDAAAGGVIPPARGAGSSGLAAQIHFAGAGLRGLTAY